MDWRKNNSYFAINHEKPSVDLSIRIAVTKVASIQSNIKGKTTTIEDIAKTYKTKTSIQQAESDLAPAMDQKFLQIDEQGNYSPTPSGWKLIPDMYKVGIDKKYFESRQKARSLTRIACGTKRSK